MPKDTLTDIIAELSAVEEKLKVQIEKLFGKVDTTDFSDEYAELQDVLAKLKAYAVQPEPRPETPVVSAK